MRSHVIVNARAARFARNPALLRDMAQSAEPARVHITYSFDDLRTACAVAAQDEAELVVLCGGDGTAMAGVTHLSKAHEGRPLPSVCLAPGGHSCTIARYYGPLRRNPRRHVDEVLAGAASGRLHPVRRPTLHVCDPYNERIGFIFGAGLVASFFEAFYERGGGGYAQASHMIARIVIGSFVGGSLARRILSPTPCTLRIEGRAHPNPAFSLIVCAVIKDLGLRLRVTHRAGEDPVRPHLVASSLGIIQCGRQYTRVLRALPLIDARTVDRLVRDFDVDFRSASGSYVLDGDLIRAEHVTVAAGPEIDVLSLPHGG
ncbi:MAG: diacylglycerol kinase family protein [Myxococcota bacterium]